MENINDLRRQYGLSEAEHAQIQFLGLLQKVGRHPLAAAVDYERITQEVVGESWARAIEHDLAQSESSSHLLDISQLN